MSQNRPGQKKTIALALLFFMFSLILNIRIILSYFKAHIPVATKGIQEWMDKVDMVRIQFAYRPTIEYDITELQFIF